MTRHEPLACLNSTPHLVTELFPRQFVATANYGPLFTGLILQLFLAGIAFGSFGRYLYTPTYASDSRPHRVLLWAVMIQLALVTSLSSVLCMIRGLNQDRSIDAIFTMGVADGLGPGMAGLSAALVQGFLLVRAARVSDGGLLEASVFSEGSDAGADWS